jgi:hypothetical protein
MTCHLQSVAVSLLDGCQKRIEFLGRYSPTDELTGQLRRHTDAPEMLTSDAFEPAQMACRIDGIFPFNIPTPQVGQSGSWRRSTIVGLTSVFLSSLGSIAGRIELDGAQAGGADKRA